MELKTADIIQETRKLQNRRKGSSSEEQNQTHGAYNPWKQPSMQSSEPQTQTNQETQLKASRDVRWQCGVCYWFIRSSVRDFSTQNLIIIYLK